MKKKLLFALFLSFAMSSASIKAQNKDTVVNAFNDLQRKGEVVESNSPMRHRASAVQISELMKELPASGYFCFTESRDNSVRLFDAIPEVWVMRDKSHRESFSGVAAPYEFFTYQIGVYAVDKNLDDVKVVFSDLKNEKGQKIATSAMKCFNLGGIDIHGNNFVKKVSIDKGKVQPLWIGVDVPKDASGVYKGVATVKSANAKPTTINVEIKVEGEPIKNHGDDQGWRMSRLNWLDSQIGGGDQPTKPYTPVVVDGNTIGYLGGELKLSEMGLPSNIITNYTDMNKLDRNIKNEVLAGQMNFIIETSAGKEVITGKNVSVVRKSAEQATWTADLKSKNFDITVNGLFEFDGFSDINIKVVSKSDVHIKDIRLEVPFNEYSTKYLVGMGNTGGLRKSDSFNWNWDVKKHQDAIWMGNVNAGINLKFKDKNYSRPLVNIYYDLGKLNLPASWGNDGKGGVKYGKSDKGIDLDAYCGERELKKGEELNFGFEMLITPVKPLDFDTHVTQRFYHSNSDMSSKYIADAKKGGANLINIHHKKDIYPYINYPYYDESLPDFKKFIADAKKEGIGTRAYYTTRELTVKIPEIWALRSMGSEVIHDGPGKDAKTLIHPNGPNQWLVDNFTTNFIPAWYNAFGEGKYKGEMDISVITTPDSRWNNYYLEGLQWMVKNIDLAGVYIDDSALDRETLKRARRILDQDNTTRLIDIHSWNHFNEWAGFANSLHMYIDLLPYVDKTWMGEGFGANNTLDFWLIEMAGIPYGLLSETLDAHNPYRGLIFCMPPRLVWSGDPTPIWKLWDEFGMLEADMYGYWSKDVPVKSTSEDLPVTVYKKKDKAIVVVANWTKDYLKGKLVIDEAKLGFKPTKAYLPEMNKIQKAGEFDLGGEFSIEGAKGLIIVVE